MNDEGSVRAQGHLGHLLASDAILPAQFFQSRARTLGQRGEYRLLIALLEDAIHVYLREGGTPRQRASRRQLREVEQWIWSTDRQWVFSFERVCEVLHIEPEYVRRGLRASRLRALGRPCAPALHVQPALAVGG